MLIHRGESKVSLRLEAKYQTCQTCQPYRTQLESAFLAHCPVSSGVAGSEEDFAFHLGETVLLALPSARTLGSKNVSNQPSSSLDQASIRLLHPLKTLGTNGGSYCKHICPSLKMVGFFV